MTKDQRILGKVRPINLQGGAAIHLIEKIKQG
jgi:hypothetical protein